MLSPSYQKWVSLVLSRTPQNNTEQLLKDYIKYIIAIAFRYPFNQYLDDHVSEGIYGLLQAIKKYDSARGEFKSFARLSIVGAIFAYSLQNNAVKIPNYIKRVVIYVRNIRTAIAIDQPLLLECANEVILSRGKDFDLNKKLKDKLEKIFNKIDVIRESTSSEYEKIILRAFLAEFSETNIDFVDSKKTLSDVELSAFTDKILLYKHLTGLTQKQKDLLEQFLNGKRFADIARERDVTRQSCSIMFSNIISKIQKSIKNK